MGWWWERGGAPEAPIYDLRWTICDLDVSALRAEMRSESEGGRREHGMVVVGKGRDAGGAYLRFDLRWTMDDLRLSSQMRLSWGSGRVSSSFLPSPGNQFPEARIPLHSGKRSFSY